MSPHLVCETQPVCRCTGADGVDDHYSCDCIVNEATGVCVHCCEPMVVIDADTGAVMGSGVVN